MKLSFIKAFTLAEALITLGIIGVISTITIPNLISTYRVKIIESRLKSTFSILSQSIKLAEAEHEECTGWDQVYSGATYVYPFMKKYFLPFVKYANEGIGTNISCPFDNNFAPYFQLMNGTTICLHRGNAMDIWIDINGNGKPNKPGFDQFCFYLNIDSRPGYSTGFSTLGDKNKESRLIELCKANPGPYCATLIKINSWKIPKNYPHKL